MRVIFAIPNYNMREPLGRLLTRLQREESEQVYVLDDASQDGSAEYVADAFPAVTVVRGESNLGPAGNRNRLLPYLHGDEVILYVDAGVELRSAGLAWTVQGWFADEKLGLAGGLVLGPDGHPQAWNYGQTMHPVREARGQVFEKFAGALMPGTPLHHRLREMAAANQDTLNLEIMYAKPVSREVDWVRETLFAVRADVFQQVGGFDARFRYHSGQDLCLRIRAHGYQVRFEPAIAVCHLNLDVRGDRREGDRLEGSFLFYQKHWGMSREVFDLLNTPLRRWD